MNDPAEIAFISFGVRLRVRAGDAGILESLLPMLPPGLEPTESECSATTFSVERERALSGEAGYTLYLDDRDIARAASAARIVRLAESNIRRHVAEFAVDRIFVHAGVVGWRGNAIVIPGRTFTGKSTLVL